jgi:hypothetical protein
MTSRSMFLYLQLDFFSMRGISIITIRLMYLLNYFVISNLNYYVISIYKFYVFFEILNSTKLVDFLNFIHHAKKFKIVKSIIQKLRW